jgi:hypothetical protein
LSQSTCQRDEGRLAALDETFCRSLQGAFIILHFVIGECLASHSHRYTPVELGVVMSTPTVVKHHMADFLALEPCSHCMSRLVNGGISSAMLRAVLDFCLLLSWAGVDPETLVRRIPFRDGGQSG